MKLQALMKTAAVAGAFALLTACANGPTGSGSEDAYNRALADAKTAVAASKKVNNQWFYKEDLLTQAEKAAAKGDYESATKLAQKAKFQADMAVKQAEDQKNAGPLK
ncbi:MAG: hypothetical protein ACOZAQ_07110 [Pseudomonadota bacterium]